MLVLARQLNERILMPTVQATIEVVAIKPGGVRLGIDAPPDVPILREEVFRRGHLSSNLLIPSATQDAQARLAQIKHVLRNRLHTVALGLDLLGQQLRTNPVPGLEAMVQRMENEIRMLDQQLRALLTDPLDDLTASSLDGRPTSHLAASCLESAEEGLSI